MAASTNHLKIYVETTPLHVSRAGVARYVRGLLAGLQAVKPGAVTLVELGWAVRNWEYAQPARALKTLWREWCWAKLLAPRTVTGGVLHHTALPVIPFIARVRHVVTLHDLALLRHPERFRRWQRTSGIRRLRRVCRADRVICPSRFTADEAMQLLGLPAGLIEVIPEAGWIELPPATAVGLPPLPAEFFLFVGSLEPGKNLTLLRHLYLTADRPLPPLVVAGGRWAGVAAEGPAPPDWRFLGHVSDAVLAELYRRALALVFPSTYEGFGLPILEAMALGCPVICGRIGSLPEVAGQAAAYAELTPAGFGAAMQHLVADGDWRRNLGNMGHAHAAKFSWERCAQETLAVYRDRP